MDAHSLLVHALPAFRNVIKEDYIRKLNIAGCRLSSPLDTNLHRLELNQLIGMAIPLEAAFYTNIDGVDELPITLERQSRNLAPYLDYEHILAYSGSHTGFNRQQHQQFMRGI